MSPTRYYMGIGGWEHEALDRCFYPHPGSSSLQKLSYYSTFFSSVEVRATFWDESLTSSDARGWSEAVAGNGDFLFLIKLHSMFTHKREIRPGATRNIRGVLQELARHNKLGGLIMQFPYSFTNTSSNRFHLTKLAELFRGFPLSVEFRHGSWDQTGLSGFLQDSGLSPVNADLPRMQQYMPFFTRTVGDTAYLRLHGRNEKGWLANDLDTRYDYLYNSRELIELKRRVENLSRKCSRVIVTFNNTTGGKAIPNALRLTSHLRGGKQLILPAASLSSFPHLQEIGSPDSAEISLFSGGAYRRAM
ncbi:MAG: DUF72 domain-containing protein [Bacteroidota bacterium]